MTKISVFGEEPKEKKELKPIEFIAVIDDCENFTRSYFKPSSYDNIMLIEKGYFNNGDLILAWQEVGIKAMYMGHWNDGVV